MQLVKIGNEVTKKKNFQKKPLETSGEELLTLISEEGQILELYLHILNSFEIEIIVRTGSSIDILGKEMDLSSNILGNYTHLDVKLFK